MLQGIDLHLHLPQVKKGGKKRKSVAETNEADNKPAPDDDDDDDFENKPGPSRFASVGDQKACTPTMACVPGEAVADVPENLSKAKAVSKSRGGKGANAKSKDGLSKTPAATRNVRPKRGQA